MLKSELADAAGVSLSTFSSWLRNDQDIMRTFNISTRAKYQQQKNYGRKSPNGWPVGHCYPHFYYRGRNCYAHKVMALSWIGPRPEGWQIDHLNGDICNWSVTNIRIVTIAENYRCALILRSLRRDSIDPTTRTAEELLTLFNLNNVAGDVYAGE